MVMACGRYGHTRPGGGITITQIRRVCDEDGITNWRPTHLFAEASYQPIDSLCILTTMYHGPGKGMRNRCKSWLLPILRALALYRSLYLYAIFLYLQSPDGAIWRIQINKFQLLVSVISSSLINHEFETGDGWVVIWSQMSM